MKEEWKNIEGYDIYEISNFGQVRTKEHKDACNRTKKTKIRKPRKAHLGHLYVTLYSHKTKSYKLFFIHRLVALAFIPNPNKLPIINHKDCDPSNNRVDNLEWCDWTYNNTYKDAIAKRNATRLKNNPNGECWSKTAAKRKKPILQYNLQGDLIAEYPSAPDAERMNVGFHAGNIWMALTGKTKTAHGYKWSYKL
jgi:hypothetical protein